MKRIVLRIILILGIISVVSGCVEKGKNEPVGVGDYSEHKIEFPSGNDEETEYNREVLSIDTFMLKIALPDGWSVSAQADNVYGLMNCFSKNYIYDKNGECVGAVGYNVVPSDLDEDSLIPIAIYNQIALGNDYRFDIKEKYDVVSSSDKTETALTDVYYSPVIFDSSEERKNKGIVSYDLVYGVYVAAEFEDDALSDEQYSHIANSLSFTGEQDTELVDMGIHNNEHNIYMGKCEDAEIRMVITRTEDDLSAAYITRDGAKNFFQGELQEDSAKFTLSNDFGDYLNMEINTDDNGMISVNGDGQISGNNVVLTLNQDTFFPIGEDFTNYYSSLGYEAEEAESFAAMIKDSVEDKAAFAKLISYPISIYDGNNNTMIENETAMVEAYDELFGQDFKEQVGNMFTKYMFANYQGICVEGGIMWFHKESSGDYKITTISLP